MLHAHFDAGIIAILEKSEKVDNIYLRTLKMAGVFKACHFFYSASSELGLFPKRKIVIILLIMQFHTDNY